MNTIIFVLKSWQIAPTKSYNPLCDAHQKQGEIQILWSLQMAQLKSKNARSRIILPAYSQQASFFPCCPQLSNINARYLYSAGSLISSDNHNFCSQKKIFFFTRMLRFVGDWKDVKWSRKALSVDDDDDHRHYHHNFRSQTNIERTIAESNKS